MSNIAKKIGFFEDEEPLSYITDWIFPMPHQKIACLTYDDVLGSQWWIEMFRRRINKDGSGYQESQTA